MNDITLTDDGLVLAVPLPDNGHLNVRTTDGVTVNLHVESKCVSPAAPNYVPECDGKPWHDAQFLDAVFIPWSAVGVEPGECVEWVQFSETNYHFGENGEAPYCVSLKSSPTPSPTVSPTPSPTVSPTPSPTVSPTPSPTVSPTPAPDTPELAETGADVWLLGVAVLLVAVGGALLRGFKNG